MFIIGEKINSSIPATAAAIEKRDADYIRTLAKDQVEAGAGMIDVNAGTFVEQEVDLLKWLIGLVKEVTDAPLCVDSPNPVPLALVMVPMALWPPKGEYLRLLYNCGDQGAA
ncbi:MAG: hypothetical protein AB1649_12730 [Chloroflexota bacterium]